MALDMFRMIVSYHKDTDLMLGLAIIVADLHTL